MILGNPPRDLENLNKGFYGGLGFSRGPPPSGRGPKPIYDLGVASKGPRKDQASLTRLGQLLLGGWLPLSWPA